MKEKGTHYGWWGQPVSCDQYEQIKLVLGTKKRTTKICPLDCFFSYFFNFLWINLFHHCLMAWKLFTKWKLKNLELLFFFDLLFAPQLLKSQPWYLFWSVHQSTFSLDFSFYFFSPSFSVDMKVAEKQPTSLLINKLWTTFEGYFKFLPLFLVTMEATFVFHKQLCDFHFLVFLLAQLYPHNIHSFCFSSDFHEVEM